MSSEGSAEFRLSEDDMSISENIEDEPLGYERSKRSKLYSKIFYYSQKIVMFVCWLISTYCLMRFQETEFEAITISVPAGKEGVTVALINDQLSKSLCLRLTGPFAKSTFRFEELIRSHCESGSTSCLQMVLQEIVGGSVNFVSSVIHFHLEDEKYWETPKIEMVEKIIEHVNEVNASYQLHFYSNINRTIPMLVAYEFTMVSKYWGFICAVILLSLIYVAIMFELVHRTVAGIICSTLAIGVIAAVHLRPSLELVFFEWSNIDTVMLFFGVAIIIELLALTGLQDYLSVVGYQLSNGHIWPMLNCVYVFSCLLPNLFDKILLILFIAPICLRLCEIMQLECTPLLSILIIALNVGSTLTPITSIVNYNIAYSWNLPWENINFGQFILHMLPATLVTMAQSYIHLRLRYHNSNKMRNIEPLEVRRVRRLIKIWQMVASQIGGYTFDDTLAQKSMNRRVGTLRKRLKRLGKMPEKPSDFEEKVMDLRNKYPIKNYTLLIACLISLSLIFLYSMISQTFNHFYISRGWLAILAACLVLSLTAYEDIEGILPRIDWATMLFFVTLSVLMEVLNTLGLLEYVGVMLENFILNTPEDQRLTVAILSIIWISAILTTFIDNVPVADMMMRISNTLSLNPKFKLPLMPMVWSLILGCNLGGNGSILSAVANIACCGVASRHGYKLTFWGYFRIGFWIMLGNVIMASCYMLAAHVLFQWH